MAATGAYITQSDCEKRLTEATIVDIFDDDGDGSLEAGDEEDALEEFILDAESDVEDVIQKTYGKTGLTWLRDLGTDAPRSVKRMCLDMFEVRAMRRHPQYIRSEWIAREQIIAKKLEMLRVRELEIADLTEPEAQNEGGEVLSGDPDYPTPVAKFFLDGMGGVF